MSLLANVLHRSRLEERPKDAKDIGVVLEKFFTKDNGTLEDFVTNPGCVNLILQTPQLSAVVVCWDQELEKYGHNHACEKVWSWVVRGQVSCQLNKCGEKELLAANECHFIDDCDDVKSHFFFGKRGSVSVHIYCTEAMNICSHPVKCNCTTNAKVVFCNEHLSLTDTERARSIAAICEANSTKKANLCTKSLRLYTNFRDLIELLHNEVDPIPASGGTHSEAHIAKISSLLQAVRINEVEYSRYLRFRQKSYTRNLVGYDVPASSDGHHKAKFTVLILCWDKGQMSPIHDHAGSSCWVKVLKGQVREVRYDETGKDVIRDLTLHSEDVCYINDTQGVHAMGNPNPDQVAVSMHVYAPPYVLCTLFDSHTGEKKVGSMATAQIPSNPFNFVPVKEADSQPIELGEFYSLVEKSMRSGRHKEEVCGLLERLAFKEREWTEFVHFDQFRYTRSLVALDTNFSLMVLCWNSGQGTPIHDHPANVCSWVKVLRGELVLKKYKGTTNDADMTEMTVFKEGSLIDYSLFQGLHTVGNASEEAPAVSLHLYSPPLVQMGYTDSAGTERVIPVVHSATSVGRCCAADPISVCDQVIERTRSTSIDETKSESSASVSEEARSSTMENLLSFFKQEQDQTIFTNINALVRFIVIRDLSHNPSCEQVAEALSRMKINKEEWMDFVRHNDEPENLIARGKHFKLVLTRWLESSATARARPEKVSWIVCLQGQVVETQYLDGEEIHSATISEHGVTFVGNKLETTFKNTSELLPCYALRLYKK